jgi:hypothetical protein
MLAMSQDRVTAQRIRRLAKGLGLPPPHKDRRTGRWYLANKNNKPVSEVGLTDDQAEQWLRDALDTSRIEWQ